MTGIGTGVGKTLCSAVVVEALKADYWKPIQSGLDETTDSETVASLLSNDQTRIWPEAFKLQTPASPHLAARIDNVRISLEELQACFEANYHPDRYLVVEGAGGLLVPLNETDFFPDLIRELEARVIVVSSQYLGNINHSMLTAEVLRHRGLPLLGWIFNGTYHVNEEDIIRWSGLKKLGRIEQEEVLHAGVVRQYADRLRPALLEALAS